MPQLPIKITQLSKDFNLKTKDIIDAFHDLGIEKKSGGSVDAGEFELFIHCLTLKHEIKDLDAYRDGRTKITTEKAAEEAMGKTGRVLLRPSGTEPVVRVMVEAASDEDAKRHCREIADVVIAEMGIE